MARAHEVVPVNSGDFFCVCGELFYALEMFTKILGLYPPVATCLSQS